jgi:hypothetical protein
MSQTIRACGGSVSGLPSLGDAVRRTWHGPRMWMYLAMGVGVLLALNVVIVVVLAAVNRPVELHDELGE